jgi:hypothetical protein
LFFDIPAGLGMRTLSVTSRIDSFQICPLIFLPHTLEHEKSCRTCFSFEPTNKSLYND